MHIVNVGYGSTNYYVLGSDDRRLLIDVGWPGTLPNLLAIFRRKDIALGDLRYLLATHYHPDHAGLVQELKQKGLRLLVMQSQIPALPRLATYMKAHPFFVDVRLDDNVELTSAGSRALLAGIGLSGSIVETPGHSDDSVSLVLDDGAAFVGDLQPVGMTPPSGASRAAESWRVLRAMGATTAYPGHGPVRPLLDSA